jgi:tRNA A37 threonylcarbamoyladenosine biosynthesis protein TsaE
MYSSNFKPLQKRWSNLYNFGVGAEHQAHTDPHSSILKLRCFAEQIVGILYRELNLPSIDTDKFFDKLDAPYFKEIVDEPILNKFHAIRLLGNKAAHPKPGAAPISSLDALALIHEAYLLGQWLYKTYSGELFDEYPPFVKPISQVDEMSALVTTNSQLAGQLEQAKAELNKVVAAEKQAMQKIAELNQALDEVQLDEFKSASNQASNSFELHSSATRDLISIHDVFAEYSLNKGQQELIEQLDSFLSSNKSSLFLLKGYAGTGKTFITKGLTEYFKAIGRNYVLAAPTGKASKVIAKKTQSEAFTIHKTIYSMKDISEYKDDDIEGTETYKVYAELAVNEMSADTVFIVDEASMIADIYNEQEFFRFGTGFLLRDFFKYVNLDHNDHTKKVIFIGDDAQLPPVGMASSPALDANYLRKNFSIECLEFELTEVVRQEAKSGVIHNSIALRKGIDSKTFNQLTIDLNFPDLERVEHVEVLERYLASCNSQINGEAIVIAHSNADVAAFNRQIRGHFFPNCPEVCGGDKVMVVSNSNAYGFFISNGDFGLVKEVLGGVEERTITLKRKIKETKELEETPITLRFREVYLGFKELDGTARFFNAKILENLLYSDLPTLTSDENKALYLDFCIRNKGLKRGSREFKDTLRSDPYFNALRLKFGYAITCHKAQGSEWNHVFVKCKTNQSQLSGSYFRWLYTAITRTANKLYLMDPPNIKLGRGIKMMSNSGSGLNIITEIEAQFSVPKAIPPVTIEKASSGNTSNTFDIPSRNQFLLTVLQRVKDLIAKANVEIENIEHKPFLEMYFFKRSEEHSRINITFNGKSKITNIHAHELSELGDELIGLLDSLKLGTIVVSNGEITKTLEFEQQFLNEFHAMILSLASDRNIQIQGVEEINYCQRYSFVRDTEIAVFNIFYNGKSQFTKCEAFAKACSPGQLTSDVAVMLTEGMNS